MSARLSMCIARAGFSHQSDRLFDSCLTPYFLSDLESWATKDPACLIMAALFFFLLPLLTDVSSSGGSGSGGGRGAGKSRVGRGSVL